MCKPGRWKNPRNQPLLWLTISAAVLVIAFQPWDEERQRQGVKIAPDGYLELSYQSFREILAGQRTFAFPYLLRGIRVLSPSYAALPYLHVALHIGAVFVFYEGLRCLGMGGWPAWACSASLLFANVLFDYGWFLMADAAALSLAVLTVGALLVAVGRPRNALGWVGLTAGLFLTYQMRPAYLFLVGWLPLLGFVLHGMVAPRPEWLRRRKPVLLGLVTACVLPFLAFCTCRWLLANHFGLVSFGGNTAIGVAGWFLTDDLLPQLPDEVRPLARAALERRARVMPNWTLPVTAAGSLDPDLFETLATEDAHGPGNQMVWSVFVPAAEELYPNDQVTVNRRLGVLALAIFKARPRLYGQWIARTLRVAPRLMVQHNYVLRWVVGPLLLLLLVGWHGVYVLRRWWTGPADAAVPPAPGRSYRFELNSLALIGVGFAMAKVLMLSLVNAPGLRYLDAAGVFLPSVGIVIVLIGWESIRAQFLGRSMRVGEGFLSGGKGAPPEAGHPEPARQGQPV
jgi:hypothetical protein